MSNPGLESIYKVDHATYPDCRLDSAGNIDQSEGLESVHSMRAGFSSQCAPLLNSEREKDVIILNLKGECVKM